MSDSRAAESGTSHHMDASIALTADMLGRRYYSPLFQNDHVDLALGHKPLHFHVPRHLLINYSPAFRSMLEPPEPEGSAARKISGSGGNLIDLPDVDPDYFAGVLSVYYGPVLMPHPKNLSFEYAAGVLRLASIYGFALAVQWATDALREDWSTSSSTWREALINPSQDKIRQAIALINLSRDINFRPFLESAFYLLCADARWGDDPSIYGPLRKADAFLLRRGIQTLY
ncbi:hypothetical protein BOTBODRAFT_69060 [Botryobasidium botryosum FD-172 SS1]|uniref:BTB domain-containing protein n=1 Tax=Botryobasidium botryosum (strain FD-172 SS1) TaxID=930990 RepID=A0A067M457_BOTB1|nr:hypothetical protein BOTBODRAFT_69060 [Botryobasidium botryosum FD-172 SS1]